MRAPDPTPKTRRPRSPTRVPDPTPVPNPRAPTPAPPTRSPTRTPTQLTAGSSLRTGRRTAHRDRGGQLALAIYRVRKPVIAAINGGAVGVGITMTLPCDIRVVAEDAKIGCVRAWEPASYAWCFGVDAT